jgi:hypothetical protein
LPGVIKDGLEKQLTRNEKQLVLPFKDIIFINVYGLIFKSRHSFPGCYLIQDLSPGLTSPRTGIAGACPRTNMETFLATRIANSYLPASSDCYPCQYKTYHCGVIIRQEKKLNKSFLAEATSW